MTQPARTESPFSSFRAVAGAIAISLLVIAAVTWVYTRRHPPTQAREIGARLELAAGDVTVREAGSGARAVSGTPLAKGAHVAAGKGSRALVRTGDGASLFLRGDSEITLDDRAVDIARGEAWIDVPKLEGSPAELRIGKSTITASDAGFDVKLAGDDLVVYVARGLAILTSPGGRVEINAGEQATTKAGAAPSLAPVAFWDDWTGGMGDFRSGHGIGGAGSGRVYGIDPFGRAGAPAQPLGITHQTVHAVIRDGVAETEVDQTFSNPGSQPIEGWYWFTVPATATVTSFALETDGQLVEGEVIEKREAAARYVAAVRAARDPALLEWIDGRTYRARIFPIPASGTRRIVVRYLEMLTQQDGKTRYVYPLRSDDPVRFDEFSLSVDLGRGGPDLSLATSLDATVEDGGRKVTMRRSGYVPRADFQLEMSAGPKKEPVRAWRFAAGADQADYVMLRYVPDQDWSKVPPVHGDVVVVVDTSAGGDEGARQLRTATAEAILRALSDDDRFALVSLDVRPTVLYPTKEGLTPASDAEIGRALEKLSEHPASGATDLGAMFETALERLHGTEQPAIVYVGDGAPTSGETAPEALADRLRRSLSGSRARLFTVGVGPDAQRGLLDELARIGGGQAFRIDEAEQTTGQALRLASVLKTPTITDLSIDVGAGLDQPFLSSNGKISRGEEVVLLARTHHPLPDNVKIRGRLAGKDFESTYAVTSEAGVATSLVPRLWAAEYVHRLLGAPEENRSKILELGLEYGLLTPFTSSLALESEYAYAAQGIKRRRSPLRGVHLTSIQGDRQEDGLAAPFLPAAARSVMGCDKRSEAPSAADQEAVASTRAKSEEGAMGNGAAAAQAPPPPAGLATATTSPAPMAADVPSPAEATAAAAPSVDDRSAALTGAAANHGGLGTIGRGAGRPIAPAPMPKGGEQAARKETVAPKPAAPTVRAGGAAPRDATTLATAPVKPATLRPPRDPLSACSDAAARPLSDRVLLWRKRLKSATTADALIAAYESARNACELPDWRDRAALLELVEAKITTEDGAARVLEHFAAEPDAQRFLARAILRRTVDLRIAAAVSRVLFGGRVDWDKVDRELADIEDPEKKLVHLREAMLNAPEDPAGEVRLVRLLARAGKLKEAIAYGMRLRDHGYLTPTLAQQLGDVLAEQKLADDAIRTYSEIVEFDATSPSSRRLLGDIYLRHGWYAEAYRQYRTLSDLDAKEPLNWMRLAAAAAGAGRIDEALRVEREIATDKGSPGPDDPRYWARLWSAARLGLLMAEPPKAADGAKPESVARQLKNLQLFSGPATLALLTWEDLDARLAVVAADPKKDTLAGEATDAGKAGLYALTIGSDTWSTTPWAVRFKADAPPRPVRFTVVTLAWDGKSFAVNARHGELGADGKQAAL